MKESEVNKEINGRGTIRGDKNNGSWTSALKYGKQQLYTSDHGSPVKMHFELSVSIAFAAAGATAGIATASAVMGRLLCGGDLPISTTVNAEALLVRLIAPTDLETALDKAHEILVLYKSQYGTEKKTLGVHQFRMNFQIFEMGGKGGRGRETDYI